MTTFFSNYRLRMLSRKCSCIARSDESCTTNNWSCRFEQYQTARCSSGSNPSHHWPREIMYMVEAVGMFQDFVILCLKTCGIWCVPFFFLSFFFFFFYLFQVNPILHIIYNWKDTNKGKGALQITKSTDHHSKHQK